MNFIPISSTGLTRGCVPPGIGLPKDIFSAKKGLISNLQACMSLWTLIPLTAEPVDDMVLAHCLP